MLLGLVSLLVHRGSPELTVLFVVFLADETSDANLAATEAREGRQGELLEKHGAAQKQLSRKDLGGRIQKS